MHLATSLAVRAHGKAQGRSAAVRRGPGAAAEPDRFRLEGTECNHGGLVYRDDDRIFCQIVQSGDGGGDVQKDLDVPADASGEGLLAVPVQLAAGSKVARRDAPFAHRQLAHVRGMALRLPTLRGRAERGAPPLDPQPPQVIVPQRCGEDRVALQGRLQTRVTGLALEVSRRPGIAGCRPAGCHMDVVVEHTDEHGAAGHGGQPVKALLVPIPGDMLYGLRLLCCAYGLRTWGISSETVMGKQGCSHAGLLSIAVLCICIAAIWTRLTLGVRHCRKPERGTSEGWRRSGASLCSAIGCLHSLAR